MADRTKSDYAIYSIRLLGVMGEVPVSVIRPTDIARYLRVERADAKVRGKLDRPSTSLHVFVNQRGNPVTESGFTAGWQRAKAEALEKGVITRNFTFHDQRAYYTTQYKERFGSLPELHSNPATTAKVYDRSKVVKRRR